VGGGAPHVGALAARAIAGLEAVAPLQREQEALRQRGLESRARPEVALLARAEARIAHEGAVQEAVDAQPPPGVPARGRPQHRPAVEAQAGARIAAQPVVEAVEAEAAETVEVAAGHPRQLRAAHDPGRADERSRELGAVALEADRARMELGIAGPSPFRPALPARR